MITRTIHNRGIIGVDPNVSCEYYSYCCIIAAAALLWIIYDQFVFPKLIRGRILKLLPELSLGEESRTRVLHPAPIDLRGELPRDAAFVGYIPNDAVVMVPKKLRDMRVRWNTLKTGVAWSIYVLIELEGKIQVRGIPIDEPEQGLRKW